MVTSKIENSAAQLAAAANVRNIWGSIIYNVKAQPYGAKGDGVSDDTVAIQSACSAASAAGGGIVFVPDGTYNLSSKITIGVKVLLWITPGATLKRMYSGYILNLGIKSMIAGGGTIDANGATYTGDLVEISTGTNVAGSQGLQVIEDINFINFDSYAVKYTSQMGFMSKINRCSFIPLINTATSVFWPNEPVAGGNRAITNCYSLGPIAYIDACDNGIIIGNTVGILFGDTRASLIFTGAPRKLIINSNRFAHGTNLMTIFGADHTISNNVIASAVAFDSACANVKYDGSNVDQGFSGTVPYTTNFISTKNQELVYAVSWTSSGTAPSLGNADVRARYVVEGRACRVRIHINFGSTTTFGTGTYRFSIPVPSATTTYFTGSAILSDRSGSVLLRPSDGYLVLYVPAGGTVSNTSPITWASGNILIFECEYNLA